MIDRLRWATADGWTITQRELWHWARQPGMLAFGLLFPVLLMVMFGYLFGGAMSVPGGNYREFLMPGMFALSMVFGLESTYTAVATDVNRGVTDRFRSMPMAPSAVVVGRATADLMNSALGLVVLIGAGLLVGWRARGSLGDALLAVGLLLLLRVAMLWIGIHLALVSRSPETVMTVQVVVWPAVSLSNAFTPPEAMPAWLGAIAEWNPMSSTVAATRRLFGNDLGAVPDSWVAEHAVLMAIVWPVVLIAIFFPLAVRRYQGLSR
jgi:ABC-2 type transport system permease protein